MGNKYSRVQTREVDTHARVYVVSSEYVDTVQVPDTELQLQPIPSAHPQEIESSGDEHRKVRFSKHVKVMVGILFYLVVLGIFGSCSDHKLYQYVCLGVAALGNLFIVVFCICNMRHDYLVEELNGTYVILFAVVNWINVVQFLEIDGASGINSSSIVIQNVFIVTLMIIAIVSMVCFLISILVILGSIWMCCERLTLQSCYKCCAKVSVKKMNEQENV